MYDNDNDNEGLALQARVSGPWPHKKESVLLVYLARWQGVQVQTVRGQIVSQRDLRLTQCKKEMHSRIHVKVSLKKKEGKVNRSQVVVARLYRPFCSAKAECLLSHAHMQVREGDKLKVIRFPWSSTVVTTPTSTSVTSADVNTVFSGFTVHLHSRSLPVKDRKYGASSRRSKKLGQRTGGWHQMRCSGLALRHPSYSRGP